MAGQSADGQRDSTKGRNGRLQLFRCNRKPVNRSGVPTVVPSLQWQWQCLPTHGLGKGVFASSEIMKATKHDILLDGLGEIGKIISNHEPPPMSDESATSRIFFAILLCNSDIAHMHSPMLPPLAKHNFSLIEHPHDQDITASGRLRCRSMAKTTGRISYPVLDSDIQTDTPGIAGLEPGIEFRHKSCPLSTKTPTVKVPKGPRRSPSLRHRIWRMLPLAHDCSLKLSSLTSGHTQVIASFHTGIYWYLVHLMYIWLLTHLW